MGTEIPDLAQQLSMAPDENCNIAILEIKYQDKAVCFNLPPEKLYGYVLLVRQGVRIACGNVPAVDLYNKYPPLPINGCTTISSDFIKDQYKDAIIIDLFRVFCFNFSKRLEHDVVFVVNRGAGITCSSSAEIIESLEKLIHVPSKIQNYMPYIPDSQSNTFSSKEVPSYNSHSEGNNFASGQVTISMPYNSDSQNNTFGPKEVSSYNSNSESNIFGPENQNYNIVNSNRIISTSRQISSIGNEEYNNINLSYPLIPIPEIFTSSVTHLAACSDLYPNTSTPALGLGHVPESASNLKKQEQKCININLGSYKIKICNT